METTDILQDVLVTEFKDPETGDLYYIDRFGNEYEPIKPPALGALDPNAIINLASNVVGLFKKKDSASAAPANLQPVGQQIIPIVVPQPSSGFDSEKMVWIFGGGIGLLLAAALIKRLMS